MKFGSKLLIWDPLLRFSSEILDVVLVGSNNFNWKGIEIHFYSPLFLYQILIIVVDVNDLCDYHISIFIVCIWLIIEFEF